MKKFSKVVFLISIIFCFSLFVVADVNAADKKSVDLLFTSDLHSYLKNYDDVVDGKQINVGGFPRLKTLINQKREGNENLLLLDCGDIVMGTLPQALMSTDAYELRFLAQFGYDATTVGNHEFDYGAQALASMYSVAAKYDSVRPGYVLCNVDWTKTDDYTKTVKAGLDEYGTSDYIVINKGDVRIAITGCLGIDAQKCASTCELTFYDPIEAVKKTVAEIKEKEKPDMIVCLSHSGTGDILGKTEDEELARKVPDIDVIISGHTHTVLQENIKIGNTYIMSCGAYGLYTGEASLTKDGNGRWTLNNYDLILMDSSIEEDDIVLAQLDEIDRAIDEKVLEPYGYKADQIIAANDSVDFEQVNDTLSFHTETKLGNIMSDAYRCIANSTPTGREHQFDIAVTPSGTIRGTFVKGDITVAQAFEALSLGMGPDGLVGYPLVNFYITGDEVRTMTEVDASVSDLMTTARLYTSGVSFEYNPHRLILNKTVDTWLCAPIMEESRTELVSDKMYRVVTDYYTMTMLGAVTDMSKGILSIVPKDENGNPITDYNQRIVYTAEGEELKAWTALATYLDSFSENENGISVIPQYYNEFHNRKIVNKSLNPVVLIKNSNKIFYILMAVIITIIVVILVVVRTVRKNKNRKKALYQ